MNQPDRADAFRRMHQPDAGRILVLPNAWDAMSARLCRLLALAAGADGMAGGQAIDCESVGIALDRDQDVVRQMAGAIEKSWFATRKGQRIKAFMHAVDLSAELIGRWGDSTAVVVVR